MESKPTHVKVQKIENNSISMQQTTWGPIPDPDTLKKYNDIKDGIAERVLDLAFIEQKNRFDSATLKLNNEFNLQCKENNTTRISLIIAFLAVVVVIGIGFYGFYLGYATAVTTIITACLTSLVIAFIIKKKLIEPA